MFIGDPSKLWLGIGQTLWQLQNLEFTVAHYLVLTKVVPGDKDEAYHHLDKSFQFTLGQLIKKLKESVHVHPEIDGRLKYLTEERNWLVHRIYRMHHTDIHDVQRFTKLLDRINILGDEAINLAKELVSLCMQWCLVKGVKEEDIDREIDRRLQERWNA